MLLIFIFILKACYCIVEHLNQMSFTQLSLLKTGAHTHTKKTWKFLKRRKYQTTLPASWEIYMQVKTQQLELDMEQRTGSKSGKEYIKAVYCHSVYVT